MTPAGTLLAVRLPSRLSLVQLSTQLASLAGNYSEL